LRDAINQVNTSGSTITEIDFNIGTPGSAQTISLTSQLPCLTASGVFINGLRQGGTGNATPLITLDGSGAGSTSDGLLLQGSGNIVSGLIIEHFNNGIEVAGSTNTIGGTIIGNDNTVGGSAAAAGNPIAYNSGDGVLISAGAGNTITSNSILANTAGGISLSNGGNNNVAAPSLLTATLRVCPTRGVFSLTCWDEKQ
jgi:hypothetical protein